MSLAYFLPMCHCCHCSKIHDSVCNCHLPHPMPFIHTLKFPTAFSFNKLERGRNSESQTGELRAAPASPRPGARSASGKGQLPRVGSGSREREGRSRGAPPAALRAASVAAGRGNSSVTTGPSPTRGFRPPRQSPKGRGPAAGELTQGHPPTAPCL